MAKVITAPDAIDTSGFRVFLGGAIDMGEAVNWQSEIISGLAKMPGLILLNPRRQKFTHNTLDEQIKWELDALEKANAIIIWFPATAKAPVSFLETGLYMNSGRLIIGVEEGFYRQRNLELTCEYYNVPLWRNLDNLVEEVLRRMQALNST